MRNRLIPLILVLALLLSVFAGCSADPDAQGRPETIIRPVSDPQYETASMTAVPRPAQETSKDIQWINMDVFGSAELMMMTTLQGNVNRTQPSMYIIHDEIVEGSGSLNASQFWFDQLDQTYTGADAFTKTEFTDPYAMLVANKDHIKGAIIYHERLTDAAMASIHAYQSRYSDMALLNLTLMMCGQYDAVALNYIQYMTLKNDYGLELPILGDTTQFMEKDADGSFSTNRASRTVWEKVYRYALAHFADNCHDEAVAHNAGFQAATFDYYVANRIFVYNRIFNADATQEERAMEVAILNVSKPNTPVFGCWYLQADEGTMVPILTSNHKYMVVSYESFNMSWTSGLPQETLDIQEEKLTLDPSKKYIAFTFTEGDNNSYLQFRLPSMFESEAKGDYPIGWTVAATCFETNPNIIRYLRQNWSDGDGISTPEAGVGYVYVTPPAASQDQFFAISDEYLKRTGSSTIRTLQPDPVAAMPYAEHMQNLDGILCGYLSTGNNNYNNDLSHFLFRDTAIFTHYDGRDAAALIQADPGQSAFYMVTLYGWQQDPNSVSAIMETLGDDFVAVTPSQLADLYRQYYGGKFTDVTGAEIPKAMSRSELGFLYKATSYDDFDSYAGTRSAGGKEYFVYRFDLADGVNQALFHATVSGNYQIEASTDYLNWTVMAKGSTRDIQTVSFDASSLVEAGKPLYIRFGDLTPENGDGVDFYSMYMTTNLTSRSYFDICADRDASYITGDTTGEMTANGRTGTFTYRLPLSGDVVSGDLMLAAADVQVQLSADNVSFTELPMHLVGSTWYANLTGLSGTVYLKITTTGGLRQLRFSPTPDAVPQLSFSPVSNDTTRAYLLSLDENEVTETGYTSNRSVKDDAAMVFRFVTSADITEARLMLNASGIYKLSISNDGKNYTQLYEAQVGAKNPNPNTLDITEYAAGGKTVYVKFEASQQIAGKRAKLMKLRLLTNLTSDALLEKLDKERTSDATVTAGSDAELKLLDATLSKEHFLYQNQARCMNPNPEATIVYKYDTNSDEFFQALGMEKVDVTKLRISFRIGNAYKISVSGDGQNWTEIIDTNDINIQAASNLKDLSITLTDAMLNGVVYVKISRSSAYQPNKTHDGLIWNTQFFLN